MTNYERMNFVCVCVCVCVCVTVVMFADAVLFGLSHETAFSEQLLATRDTFPFSTIERTVSETRPLPHRHSHWCKNGIIFVICFIDQYISSSYSEKTSTSEVSLKLCILRHCFISG